MDELFACSVGCCIGDQQECNQSARSCSEEIVTVSIIIMVTRINYSKFYSQLESRLENFSVCTIKIFHVRMSPDERSNMTLTNSLGGTSEVIYRKAIHRY